MLCFGSVGYLELCLAKDQTENGIRFTSLYFKPIVLNSVVLSEGGGSWTFFP